MLAIRYTVDKVFATLAAAVRETLTETYSKKHTSQFETEVAAQEGDEDMQAAQPPSILVFSGGTAFNSVAGTVVTSQRPDMPSAVQLSDVCWCNIKKVHIYVQTSRHHAVEKLGTVDWYAGTLRSFTTRVAHVLPVSDDGGSTAEIVRVLGGPAVGDIRSRCLRLADDSNTEVINSLYSEACFN